MEKSSKVYLFLVLLSSIAYSGYSHSLASSYLENEIQTDYSPDELQKVRVKKSSEEEKLIGVKTPDESKHEKRELQQQIKLTDVDFKQGNDKLIKEAGKDVERVRRQHIQLSPYPGAIGPVLQPFNNPQLSIVNTQSRTVPGLRTPLLQGVANGFGGPLKDVAQPLFGASLQTDNQLLPIMPGLQLSSGLYAGSPPQVNSYSPYQPGNAYGPQPYGSLLPPPTGYIYQPSPYICTCYPPNPPHYPPHDPHARSVDNGNSFKYPFLMDAPRFGNIGGRAVDSGVPTTTLPKCAVDILSNVNPGKSVMEGLVQMEETKLKRIEECAKSNGLSKSDYDTLMRLVTQEISMMKNQVNNGPQQTQMQPKPLNK